MPEDFRRHLSPSHDRPLPGDYTCGGLIVVADKMLARNIARADVFAQGEVK